MLKEINVLELKSWIENKEDFQLIDVREPYEAEIAQIGGELIPMGDIPTHVDRISKDKKVVIHCRSGARSANIIHFLQEAYGYDNLYNLAGGILAWSDLVDPSVSKY